MIINIISNHIKCEKCTLRYLVFLVVLNGSNGWTIPRSRDFAKFSIFGKTAVIFALDNSNNEPKYEAMSVLLVKSILEYSPSMDIYCGVFTQRTPGDRVEMLLKDAQVNMVYDPKFIVEKDSINYFLRNYCCYYFSHEHNLLEEYDKLIYLDMDEFGYPLNVL